MGALQRVRPVNEKDYALLTIDLELHTLHSICTAVLGNVKRQETICREPAAGGLRARLHGVRKREPHCGMGGLEQCSKVALCRICCLAEQASLGRCVLLGV